MKRKTLSLTLCLLTCLALIGVGFAAWLITYSATANTESNIVVDTVSEKHYYISYAFQESAPSKQSITFGAPSERTNSSAWLTSDGTKIENLEVVYKVTIKDSNDPSAKGIQVQTSGPAEEGKPYFKATLSVSDPDGKWAAAKDAHLVTLSETAAISAVQGNSEDGYYYLVTITANWGSYFDETPSNPVNPYVFFNSKGSATTPVEGGSGTTWGEEALAKLTAIQSINAKFVLTLTVE